MVFFGIYSDYITFKKQRKGKKNITDRIAEKSSQQFETGTNVSNQNYYLLMFFFMRAHKQMKIRILRLLATKWRLSVICSWLRIEYLLLFAHRSKNEKKKNHATLLFGREYFPAWKFNTCICDGGAFKE